MPWSACQGLPDGPCPKQRCDKSVVMGCGELMLCKDCDTERRQLELKKLKEQQATSEGRSNPEGTKPTTHLNSFVVNELLLYIKHYKNKCQSEGLKRTIHSSFCNASITEAKKLLIKLYKNMVDISQFVADRRNSTMRSAAEADLDDIFGMLEIIEQRKVGITVNIVFVAVNLDLIPKGAPGEQMTNEDKQNQTEPTCEQNPSSVQLQPYVENDANISARLNKMQQSIDDMSTTIQVYMSNVSKPNNDTCSFVTEATTVPTMGCDKAKIEIEKSDPNRLANLIVYGVPENRNAAEWRQVIDEILTFLLNKPVDLVDSFRLGRYDENKTRPILIKLSTRWDRRLLLTKRNQLKNNPKYQKIFIAPDEPIKVRRRHSLERLKKIAEGNGHQTEVNESDNVLYVDGIALFSISNGLIGDRKIILRNNAQKNENAAGSPNHNSPATPSSE